MFCDDDMALDNNSTQKINSNILSQETNETEETYCRTRNHPRSHSRSRSWSHALWMRNHQNNSQRSSEAMDSIFSPIRGVIQGIVPALTESTSSNTNAARFPASPMNRHLPATLNHTTTSSVDSVSRPSSTSHVRSRSDVSRHSRQSSAVEIDMTEMMDSQIPPGTPTATETPGGNRSQEHMEFYGTITWVEKAIPFILLLLSRIMWDHRLGILVFIGLFGTYFHVNAMIRNQVSLKEKRLNTILLGVLIFLFANTFFIYYVFNSQSLHHCLLLRNPQVYQMDIWTVFWCVVITDFVVRFVTMAIKCFIIILPRRIIDFRKRGKYFLLIENLSQFYRMLLPVRPWYNYFSNYASGGEYFAFISTVLYFILKSRMLFLKAKEILHAVKCFGTDTRYGRTPTKEALTELADSCPICQEEMSDPIELNVCKHIFCEDCIVMWFDRERTCPMCRANVADDPQWRDGSTQTFIQVF